MRCCVMCSRRFTSLSSSSPRCLRCATARSLCMSTVRATCRVLTVRNASGNSFFMSTLWLSARMQHISLSVTTFSAACSSIVRVSSCPSSTMCVTSCCASWCAYRYAVTSSTERLTLRCSTSSSSVRRGGTARTSPLPHAAVSIFCRPKCRWMDFSSMSQSEMGSVAARSHATSAASFRSVTLSASMYPFSKPSAYTALTAW
mmetsp:Transcript_37244/g.92079  ORF Transcript_37244/g.92079 Transcript_37244/m.92079 type:complete len:202 (-) Transcript_37244:1814-2419(-)